MASPVEPPISPASPDKGDPGRIAASSDITAARPSDLRLLAANMSPPAAAWTWYQRAVLSGLVGITLPLLTAAIGIMSVHIVGLTDPAVLKPLVLLSSVAPWVGVVARICSLLLFWKAFLAGVGRKSTLLWMTCLCLLGETLLMAGKPIGIIFLAIGILTMLAYANLAAIHRQARRDILINRIARTALLALCLLYFGGVTRRESTGRNDALADMGDFRIVVDIHTGYVLSFVVELVILLTVTVLMSTALRNAHVNRGAATKAVEAESVFR